MKTSKTLGMSNLNRFYTRGDLHLLNERRYPKEVKWDCFKLAIRLPEERKIEKPETPENIEETGFAYVHRS